MTTEGTLNVGAVQPDEFEQDDYVAYIQVDEKRVLLTDEHAANVAALLENLRGAAKLARTQDPLPLRDGTVTLDSGVGRARGE